MMVGAEARPGGQQQGGKQYLSTTRVPSSPCSSGGFQFPVVAILGGKYKLQRRILSIRSLLEDQHLCNKCLLSTRGGGANNKKEEEVESNNENALDEEKDLNEEEELDDEDDSEVEEEEEIETAEEVEDTVLVSSIKSKQKGGKAKKDTAQYDEPYFLSPSMTMYTTFGAILISRKIDLFQPSIVRLLRYVSFFFIAHA
jgi:hypothetical protein